MALPARVPELGQAGGSDGSPAAVFAALGDETRLGIVVRLSEANALSITRLAEGTGLSRQAVTKHLRVLADAGLVAGARDGREHRWQLERAQFDQARETLAQISAHWDQALERLRRHVEG